MKVWLDDERPLPSYYDVHVTTAKEAIDLLKAGKVTEISLDYDLGDTYCCPENSGLAVAKYIEQSAIDNTLSQLRVAVHTMHEIGRPKICEAIRKAIVHWRKK